MLATKNTTSFEILTHTILIKLSLSIEYHIKGGGIVKNIGFLCMVLSKQKNTFPSVTSLSE